MFPALRSITFTIGFPANIDVFPCAPATIATFPRALNKKAFTGICLRNYEWSTATEERPVYRGITRCSMSSLFERNCSAIFKYAVLCGLLESYRVGMRRILGLGSGFDVLSLSIVSVSSEMF